MAVKHVRTLLPEKPLKQTRNPSISCDKHGTDRIWMRGLPESARSRGTRTVCPEAVQGQAEACRLGPRTEAPRVSEEVRLEEGLPGRGAQAVDRAARAHQPERRRSGGASHPPAQLYARRQVREGKFSKVSSNGCKNSVESLESLWGLYRYYTFKIDWSILVLSRSGITFLRFCFMLKMLLSSQLFLFCNFVQNLVFVQYIWQTSNLFKSVC